MGTFYKITDKVWGITDMPWPFFYGIQAFVFLKIIIGGILLCLVALTYPLLYIIGVWYLIRNKKKPNWLYFALYTGLMIWYIFCIVKYLVLGYPMESYSGWPAGDKPVFTYDIPDSLNSETLIWKNGELVPFDDSLEVAEPDVRDATAQETGHFRMTVIDGEYEYEWLNRHRIEQNLEPLHLTARQIKNLAGTYEWDSNIKFSTQAQLLNYVCKNFEEMQKYKVHDKWAVRPAASRPQADNICDEYNDRLDDYLSDPEDELEFSPEVFDFQDD